jgi:hypothetical protein
VTEEGGRTAKRSLFSHASLKPQYATKKKKAERAPNTPIDIRSKRRNRGRAI